MKKKGLTHAERRENARPDEWKPQPKLPKIAYEPPKPVKQTAPKRFSKADIERLKQKAADKLSGSPSCEVKRYVTVNLEDGMPLVDAAIRHMETSAQGAYARGARAIKFIHGYGSTGKGGAIKKEVRARLMKLPHVIRVIPGEEFTVAQLPKEIPELSSDPDRKRINPGVTVAILG